LQGETSGGIKGHFELNVTICGLETLILANNTIEERVLKVTNTTGLNDITWSELTSFYNFSAVGGLSHVDCGTSLYTLW
jgi:hypothetical protein